MTFDQEIQSLVDDFTARVRGVVLRRTRDALGIALTDTAPVVITGAPKTKKTSYASPTIGKGEKRKPADLVQLTEAVVAIIENEPGLRVEQIAARLAGKGHPGLERGAGAALTVPLKKAMATRRVKRTGTRRATRYFPQAKRG